MKSRILKTSIGSIIFLLLVIAVIALIFPTYKKINAAVSVGVLKITQKIEEKTGIEISYEALSPSILSGISFKNINLKDSATQKQLVQINSAVLSYNLRDFFSKKPLNAVKLLLLDGLKIEYDAVKDGDLLKNFSQIFEKNDDEKNHSKKHKSSSRKFTIDGKEINIPFNVQLKNISLHFVDSKNDFLAIVKTVTFEQSPLAKNSLKIKTSGRLELKSELLKSAGQRKLVACGFELSGNFFKNLDGSSFLLKLSEINRADFTISKIDFLLNYADSKIALRTMRSAFPFSMQFEANFKNQELSFDAQSRNFEPLKLIKVKNPFPLYKKFVETKFSGTAKARTSFLTKEDFFNSAYFKIDGDCNFSEKIAGSPVVLSYGVECKNQVLKVNKFVADGKPLNLDLNGELNLKTLEPSFVLSLPRFQLANGGILQTELYIEPYKKGFMCFAPQLFMDEKSLTAIQFTLLPSAKSVDFSFECDDYSHAEYEKSAKIVVEGSFLNETEKFLQASVSVSDMFLDSVIDAAAFFVPEEKKALLANISKSAGTYIFSDEIYFTTDFKSFSFNSPYFLLANTAKEKQLLTFAVDGSSETITLSSLDLQYGNQTAHATAGIDFSNGLSDFNFYTDLVVNSLPFSFRGACSQNFLNVSGDYNFNAAFSFEKNIFGSVEFTALPVSFGKTIFSTSLNTSFSWNEVSGIEVEINNFDIDEPYGSLRLHPHLAFTGSANKYGFVMNKLAYSDAASALDGRMNVIWSLNDGIFDSIIVDLNAKSILNSEKISLNAEVRNLEKKLLTLDNFKNDFYVSAQGNLSDFPAARFFSDQNSTNKINADFSLSGTPVNPLISLNFQSSSINFAGYPCVFSGNAVYDDTGLSVSELNADWGKFALSDFFANLNLKNFSGDCTAVLKGKFLELDFNIPIKSSINCFAQGNSPVKNFVATVKSEKMTGSFFPTEQKLDLKITKSDDIIDFVSANGRGISGSFIAGQVLTAKSGPDSPLGFNLNGSIVHNQLDLNIKNINADMKTFCQAFSIPFVRFTGGKLSGAVKIGGLTTDPEYTGSVVILNPEFYVPIISKKLFRSEKVVALASQNHFVVKPTLFTVEKNPVNVGLNIEFDRWKIGSLDCPIESPRGQFIPVDLKLPLLHYKGFAAFEKFLIHMTTDTVGFSGKIFGERAEIEIIRDGLNMEHTKKPSFDFLVDLKLQVKNKVQILFNPLLRGLIVPDNYLDLYIDTSTGDLSAKGEVNLRGGEIVWLNRSFYMKEGKVVFNEYNEVFDPRITVRAETRERDENNNQVTITLSATQQALSQFNPRFTATPAKSENEIMELLGQVISGNSENVASLAMAGGDYLMQATVMRTVENTLRELLNFDIFSVRTNILQNAVKQSLEKNSAGKQLSFSNFFDNSAVYVGKYFGSAMYVDALMHWSYDETKAKNEDSVRGLVLQPEFGFEMSSPFVNIRFGVSPDLEAIKNSLWIPSTSVTLSWKHSF